MTKDFMNRKQMLYFINAIPNVERAIKALSADAYIIQGSQLSDYLTSKCPSPFRSVTLARFSDWLKIFSNSYCSTKNTVRVYFFFEFWSNIFIDYFTALNLYIMTIE